MSAKGTHEVSTSLTSLNQETAPLRGEPYSQEHLNVHAMQIARALQVDTIAHDGGLFQQRFRKNCEALTRAYRQIAADARLGEPVTPDVEWLLDNFYVVEEQLREIEDDLPTSYFRELPKLSSGEPRVYKLALELIIHTDSALDEQTITRFVQNFQTVAPLSIGEIWAFPIMLRLGLVENLRRLADRMLCWRHERDAAVELVEIWNTQANLPPSLRDAKTGSQLAMHILVALGNARPNEMARLETLAHQLAVLYPSGEELIRQEHQLQAANQVTIGNVITSMRLISALDWITFFEETNLADETLRQDPAGIYGQMDFESRDRYRHVIEEIAKHSNWNDLEVARHVVHLSQSIHSDDQFLKSHVGYWLIDEGRTVLEQAAKYRPSVWKTLQRTVVRAPSFWYLGSIAVVTILGTTLLLASGVPHQFRWPAVVLGLLAVVPLSELAVQITNFLVTHLLKPRLIPKLELKGALPDSLRTIVVVPSMLTSEKEARSLVQRLELHYLANPDPSLRFALLTDFADAASEHTPHDAPILDLAIRLTRELNGRYGRADFQPFYLLHRARQWNPSEQAWMGWERKRGKLAEFNRLLMGNDKTSYTVIEGNRDELKGTIDRPAFRFVITLDADTELPHGVAKKLIGALAHPLNQARFNEDGLVRAGYGLLQPRVTVQMENANRTPYAQLFASSKGIDPYSSATSDVYQDLYREGSFTGKGIYDLLAFEKSLHGAFRENQILSHDLIEGCHARVGLVSDIELIDGFPTRYDADARRQHRWVRGDWQILPWLFPTVPCATGTRSNPLSFLSRWKIFDNLRRSLFAPSLLAFLIVGWVFAPSAAWLWTLTAAACLAFPALATIYGVLRSLPGTIDRRGTLRAGARDLAQTLSQTGINAALLPHKAAQMIDAIARTLCRMILTKRKLLEWETAAAAESRLSQGKWSIFGRLWYLPMLAVGLLVVIPIPAMLAASPWLLAWLLGPLIAYAISQPYARAKADLGTTDTEWLRLNSRKTWAYFEACVTAERNWLPPDNVQEYPEVKVAERISPTNQGLFMVSGLVAREFGYISLYSLMDLWEQNLKSWMSLTKLKGHFYNWYDTVTKQPLLPRYVSTVDSGNLAACLIVVRQGTEELLQRPIFGEGLWKGWKDTLRTVEEAGEDLQPRGARLVNPPLDALLEAVRDYHTLCADPPQSLEEWHQALDCLTSHSTAVADRLDHFERSRPHPSQHMIATVRSTLNWAESVSRDFKLLYPWVPLLTQERTPEWCGTGSQITAWQHVRQALMSARSLTQISELESVCKPYWAEWKLKRTTEVLNGANTKPTLDGLRRAIEQASQTASQLSQRMRKFGERAEKLAFGMDFQFLYNPQRRLFSIGYNVEEGNLDRSFYDMLCSEARLSSYVAIAKGDVPARHWFALGRQATYTAGRAGLLSWGGTMFEFLMPPLFLKMFEGSLLLRACETAIARQQEYGQKSGIPWGVSESAYGALAVNSDYHYQSFGVPGLGLKRGLSKDFVVAPYSTMMALPLAPQSAIDNLRKLEDEEATGRWGFFDAIDYTPERVPAGRRSILVRCYMAHHQGMSFLGLANLLLDKPIQRWFHSHPAIRSAELLLQERTPNASPSLVPHEDETEVTESRVTSQEDRLVSRRLIGYLTPTPRTHLLSNGRYSVMLTNTGGGSSHCDGLAITRWRSEVNTHHWGQFLYLRDLETNAVWSPTYQPTLTEPDAYEVIYSIDKADFHRRDGDLETLLEVTVSPENNTEARSLRISNQGLSDRELEITSYAEVVLTTDAADRAHPAFQKLFVETEYIEEETALIAKRRPRDSQDPSLYAVHMMSCRDANGRSIQYESSRNAFVGRGRTLQNPLALTPGQTLSQTTGLVLDPIFSLRCTVTVPANSSVTVTFCTGFAQTRETAMRLADQYHDLRGVSRAFELAWAFNQVQLRHLHLNASQAQQYQRLASAILYPDKASRGSEDAIQANRLGQSSLWRYGISGDRPILLVKISREGEAAFIREILSACDYWNLLGLKVDLVILNIHPGTYLDSLQEQLHQMVAEGQRQGEHLPRSAFVLRGTQIPREDHLLLETTAAVVLRTEDGWNNIPFLKAPTPSAQTTPKEDLPTIPLVPDGAKRPPSSAAIINITSGRPQAGTASQPEQANATLSTKEASQLEFWNGLGGFAENGREYHLHLADGKLPPMPWSNVIANARLGCVITETGGGFTWSENSRENKLTTWANDPVSDTPSEMLYLCEEATGQVSLPLPYATQDNPGRASHYEVHHGQGYSQFLHTENGLRSDLTISVASEAPVKLIRLRLTNLEAKARSVSVTYYAELVLGVHRGQTKLHLVTEKDVTSGAILVRNAYHADYPQQVVFLNALGSNRSLTADASEFFGRHGSLRNPRALKTGNLSGTTGAALDPCGALRVTQNLAPGETAEVCFLLGAGRDLAEAQQLLAQFTTTQDVNHAIEQTQNFWADLLGTLQVQTPDRSMDLLVNHWLLYQTLSCRLWGRSAYYQSGGAFGFRDQLQDVMALVYSRPDLARAQILLAASRQFEEGDVQHWWHPPTGRGTRTRFSDDLLFLPFVVAHYIRVTGDMNVLDETVSFLQSEVLQPHEQERYEQPNLSSQRASLYDHCLRAIHRGFQLGEHGLPLMGCGDWNDGMNRVGHEGRGESVWVGWFLIVLLDRFIPLMKDRGDLVASIDYRNRVETLRKSLETHAWDGKWYRRAYFDDGTPLGSQQNDEGRIDSLSQSWAVLAGADPQRTDQALQAVFEHLVKPEEGLVALLTLAFNRSALDPGYIKGYLPGVRENGGQYTHAVAWLIQALATKGNGERASEIFQLINPINHTETPMGRQRYQVEPYVMAADVYSVVPHVGRGGWTWYTGSAAWIYRSALESILGFDRVQDTVYFHPCVPASWNEFRLEYQYGTSRWYFTVRFDDQNAPPHQGCVLTDDGQPHHVEIVVPRSPKTTGGTPEAHAFAPNPHRSPQREKTSSDRPELSTPATS